MKNSPRATVALILLIAPEMATTRANCAMMIRSNQSEANCEGALAAGDEVAATAAVSSRPGEHPGEGLGQERRESCASGLTPTAEGDA